MEIEYGPTKDPEALIATAESDARVEHLRF
jgi:hypothetical protein